MEDKYHDPDTMVSMAVIEHESAYLKVMITKYKNQPDEKEFFEMRIESLDFAKSSIETNVQTGIVTPESYIKQINVYHKKLQQQAQKAAQELGAKNEHVQRLNKRVSVVKNELAEMGVGMEEAQEEKKQPPKKATQAPAQHQ